MKAVLEIFLAHFSGFVRWKYKFYRPCVWNPASGWLQIDHNSEKKVMTPQFADMTSSSNFLNIAVFFLSSLVTGLSFISVS